MRRETLRLRQRQGSGGLTVGARRTGRRRSRESVRVGRWRRLFPSLRQEQLQAAAGSSGHGGGGGGGSSLQTPGSGSSTAPHTPGTWEPGNRFRPSGAPSPVQGTSAAALPPLASAQSRSGSVRALPPVRSPVSGCGVGSSSLPSFLPLSLGPGGGGGGGGGSSSSTSPHSPGSGAALCEECRLRSRLALPHSPSPLLLVLRLLPPPPSLTPPSAPPPAQIQGASQAESEFSDIKLRTKLLERQRPWATAPRPVAEAIDKSEGDCASCALPSPAFQKGP
ncbi:hypothetical protein AB1E18_000225 [Capra hircus]